MEEIWKDIKGYEGLYQVSNMGRVRRNGNILSLNTVGHGYHSVSLSKNGIVRKILLHRLVAEAFIPNPENKPQVNHIDEDKTNNTLSNLEWVTAKENMSHGNRPYMNMKAIRCVELDIEYMSVKEASEKLDIARQSITHVLHGRRKRAGGYSFEYKK